MPGAALSAATTVGSGVLGATAAGKASKAASAAANQSRQFLNGVYNTAETNLDPTITSGKQAGNALSGLLGIGGDPAASQRAFDQFRNSTNYNFLLDQGTQAVKTANAPSFNSGATAKALLNYGQGMAGNALQGYENMLQGQQQLGAQSALGLGQIGTGAGSALAGVNSNAAAAQGGAAIYGGNALSGMLGGLNNVGQQILSSSSFKQPTDTGVFAGVTPSDVGAFNVGAALP